MRSLEVWLLKALCCMVVLSSCCIPAAKKKSPSDLGDQPTDKMSDSSDQEDHQGDDSQDSQDSEDLPASVILDNQKTVSWENQPDWQYFPGYLKAFDCDYTSLVLNYVWNRHPVAQNKEKKLDHELLADNTVRTLLRTLDPYRAYFTQDEVDSLVDQYDSRFFLDVLELGLCHHLVRLRGELEKTVLSRQADIIQRILSDHDYTQKEFFSPYGVFTQQDPSYYQWPSKSELPDRQRRFVKWLMLTHQNVGRYSILLEDHQNADSGNLRDKLRINKLSIKERILQTDLSRPFLQTNESFQFAFGKALLWGLDNTSVLLDRVSMHAYYSDNDLRSSKLGLSFLAHPSGYMEVYRIVGGSDAEGRLQQGDLITHLREGGEKWTSIKKVALSKAYDILSGPVGTQVDLKVQRPVGKDSSRHQSFELSLERRPVGELDIPAHLVSHTFEVVHDQMDRPVKVGYIVQNGFYQGHEGFDQSPSDDKVAEIVQNFMANGVDTIILDYRQNSGGDWAVAADLVNIFHPKSTAYYQTSYEYSQELGESQKVVQAMSSDKEHGDVGDREAAQQVPLVVLVSSATASAAEMVVGALKVHGRALVIGEDTYGHGLVTETKRLFKPFFRHVLDQPTDEQVGGIRYVTGHFLKPDGKSSHIIGEAPDISLASPFGAIRFGAIRKEKWGDATYRGQDNDFTAGQNMEKESSPQLGFRDSGMLQKLTAIYSQRILSSDYRDLHSQWIAEVPSSPASAIQKDRLSRQEISIGEDNTRVRTFAAKLAIKQQIAMRRFMASRELGSQSYSDSATHLRKEDHELQEALFVAANYFWLCRGDDQDLQNDSEHEPSYNKLLGCFGSQAVSELGDAKNVLSESRKQAAEETAEKTDKTPETEQSEMESENP